MPNDDDGQDCMFRFIPLKEVNRPATFGEVGTPSFFQSTLKNLALCTFIHLLHSGTGTPSTNTPPVLLNGTPIKIVTKMRVLGVIVDNKLSWSPHVESVISKVCRRVYEISGHSFQRTQRCTRLAQCTKSAIADLVLNEEHSQQHKIDWQSIRILGRAL